MAPQSRGVGPSTPGTVIDDDTAARLGLGRHRVSGTTLDDRLWPRVQKGSPDECWPWTGGLNKDGYGRMQWDGKLQYVHRLAYIHTNGALPAGTEIDHICHNRACVKPSHLRAATYKQNAENRGNLRQNTSSGVRGVTGVPRKVSPAKGSSMASFLSALSRSASIAGQDLWYWPCDAAAFFPSYFAPPVSGWSG